VVRNSINNTTHNFTAQPHFVMATGAPVSPPQPLKTVQVAGATYKQCLAALQVEAWDHHIGGYLVVTIPHGTTSIADSSFAGVEGVMCVIIPSTVVTIGKYAFRYTPNLMDIIFRSGCQVREIDAYAFQHSSLLNFSTLPSGVQTIGVGAFAGTKLRTITLPTSLTRMREGAFLRCNDLGGTIKIPSGLTELSSMVFELTGKMTVTFAVNTRIVDIKDRAFANSKIHAIHLPGGLKSIGAKAFAGSGLLGITFPPSLVTIGNHAFVDTVKLVYIHDWGKDPSTYLPERSLYKPAQLVSIGAGAFQRSGVRGVLRIPHTLTAIGDHAFYKCVDITHVIWPPTTPVIREHMFTGCTSLRELVVPPGINTIEPHTFRNCSNLTTVVMGPNVTRIGQCAFADCERLLAPLLPDVLRVIGKGAFKQCRAMTEIIIPPNVSHIRKEGFARCANLATVVFKGQTIHIDAGVFLGCAKLTSVRFPSKIGSLDPTAFAECPLLEVVATDESADNTAIDVLSRLFTQRQVCSIPTRLGDYRKVYYWSPRHHRNISTPQTREFVRTLFLCIQRVRDRPVPSHNEAGRRIGARSVDSIAILPNEMWLTITTYIEELRAGKVVPRLH
jgi:hypothetical protein